MEDRAEQRQKRRRRRFTDEFKAGAARLVLIEGKSVTAVARELDLTASSLAAVQKSWQGSVSRVVIEGCARLDVRVFNRRGWRYGAQAISFSTGQRIWLRGTPDTLKVQIFDRGPECEIPIVKSAMHFGGWREYFRCPTCLMRVAILYIATHAFRW